MKVVFRTDASIDIGSGHVMRCLTLANALRGKGVECHFICRELTGHMLDVIRESQFALSVLSHHPADGPDGGCEKVAEPEHAGWLGCRWQTDAEQCRTALDGIRPDWLVVDHYALDHRWELSLQSYYRKMMVIDDLADRRHHCDVLLDQTFGRSVDDYKPLVPGDCLLLCGSLYALLRPEFAKLRAYSLERRVPPQLRQLLVTMGGVDRDNCTGQVLAALKQCKLPENSHITVVLGGNAPWITEVKRKAAQMVTPTDVLVNVSDIAQLMAESDLAIGAAGATSWERCCLGLPTVMVVLADNQRLIAEALEKLGAVQVLSHSQQVLEELPGVLTSIISQPVQLSAMSLAGSEVTNGLGVETVVNYLKQ